MIKACWFIKDYTKVYHSELSSDELLIYSGEVGMFSKGWDSFIYDSDVTSEEDATERLKEDHLNYLQDQIDELNSTIRKINLL